MSALSYLVAQGAARALSDRTNQPVGAGDPTLLDRIQAHGITAQQIAAKLAEVGRRDMSSSRVQDILDQVKAGQIRNWQSGAAG